MFIKTDDIVRKVQRLKEMTDSCDPFQIASDLNIMVIERNFEKQLGMYTKILSTPFIFLKNDLDDFTKRIVLLHEIGHHVLHGKILDRDDVKADDLTRASSKMELEANYFAAELSIPDEEILDLIKQQYSSPQIAQILTTNNNYIALKVELLNKKGHNLNRQEYSADFMNYIG